MALGIGGVIIKRVALYHPRSSAVCYAWLRILNRSKYPLVVERCALAASRKQSVRIKLALAYRHLIIASRTLNVTSSSCGLATLISHQYLRSNKHFHVMTTRRIRRRLIALSCLSGGASYSRIHLTWRARSRHQQPQHHQRNNSCWRI